MTTAHKIKRRTVATDTPLIHMQVTAKRRLPGVAHIIHEYRYDMARCVALLAVFEAQRERWEYTFVCIDSSGQDVTREIKRLLEASRKG
jgi:hypothetical protein